MNIFFKQAMLYCLTKSCYQKLLALSQSQTKRDYYALMNNELKAQSSDINDCFFLLPNTRISGQLGLADIYFADLWAWQLTFTYDYILGKYALSFREFAAGQKLELNSRGKSYVYLGPNVITNSYPKSLFDNELYLCPLQHGDILTIANKSLLFCCPKNSNDT